LIDNGAVAYALSIRVCLPLGLNLNKNVYIVHNNEMSEYDLLRLSNIKRNEDYVKSLELDASNSEMEEENHLSTNEERNKKICNNARVF